MTAIDPLSCAVFVITAFVLAGFVHTAWLRSSVSRRLAVPLDGGLTLRGRRLFGDNKTVRGFVAMLPGAGAAFYLLAQGLGASPSGAPGGLWPMAPGGYGLLGLTAGFGFMAGELPNSFVKRQLGIPPGQPPAHSAARPLCFVVDRLDSIVGMLAAMSLVVPTPWPMWVYVLGIGPALHYGFSTLLFLVGVKTRPA